MDCSGNGPILSEEAVEHWYASEPDEDTLLNDLLFSKNDLESFIKKELSNKAASLMVHHLARASSSRLQTSRQNVLELLSHVADSPLLSTRGMQLLDDLIGNDKDTHPFECIVTDFITILRHMSSFMPSLVTTPQIIGFVDWMKNVIADNMHLENKESLLDSIFELKSEIMKNIAVRASVKKERRKNFEDTMHPPESFRTIPVMPEENDLFYKTGFLRRNKAHGKYIDLEHYLDVQFRLYREDCIAPLRDVFEEFVAKNKENKRYFRLDSGRIYRDIQILKGTSTSLEHGEVFVVELNKDHCKRIHWKHSKRLIYGSLLLLSFDKFESIIFAVVSDMDRDAVKETGQFKVQIFKAHQDQQIPRETNGIILEATSAYFESYHHVLNTMHTINDDTLLFQKYIVKCCTDVDVPLYLSIDPETTFDLQPIISNITIRLNNDNPLENDLHHRGFEQEELYKQHRIKLLDVDQWPSKEDLNMDESQRQAFISALTREFVLIQGPPGTGKTYLGLQIAKALLHNRDEWKATKNENQRLIQIARNRRDKPCILIVCFTNHALDQFVEGIIDFLPRGDLTDIVRIGSQCKNPRVDKHSIKNHRQHFRRQRRAADVIDEADERKLEIKRGRGFLKSLQGQSVVFGYHEMKKVMSTNHAMSFRGDTDTNWFDWLHVLLKNWFKEVHNRYKQKNYRRRVPLNISAGSDQEFLNVIEEADYEYSERSLDEDTEYVFNANTIGIDVLAQLNLILQTTHDEKCRQILQDEADNIIQQLKSGEIASEVLMQSEINIWQLSLADRWKMYRYWLKNYVEKVKENLTRLENEFNMIFKKYKQARMEIDEDIMKEASVIAMTTTGAAKYRDSLRKIGPKITIIEEAAEVPEAHIIAAINPKCDHLILIGDHKQLEPKPAVRELAVKYNLSLSLFERMLNNGLHYHCLERQHRMRPEISELVRHMYPVLHDNENVFEYENVKGIRQNLFFIDHQIDEQYNEDGKSFSNEHEAEYLKELCGYLLKQGYKPSEITIIAAYTGQMFCIRGKMPRSRFEGISICVLDNYQGEENEIILLSLVRSNKNGDIGFLNRENRICVALSRAKKGLYIIGNSSTLTSNSKHWQYIVDKIKERKVISSREFASDDPGTVYKSFGTALPLYCQNHPNEDGILASFPVDFSKAPDGGCEKLCERRLSCGHACRYRCHPFDPEHEEYLCAKLCLKRCKENHTCRKECHFPEGCTCSVLMKRLLRCDHTANLECWEDPGEHLCQVKVLRNLDCGHSVVLECHIEPHEYFCKEIVTEERTDCGHEFKRKCHDSEYEKKHKCDVSVMNTYSDCGHEFKRQCHDSEYERTHKCNVKVTKTYSDCGHSRIVACSMDLKFKKCNTKIEKTLECGHEHSILCCQQHYGYTYFDCTQKCCNTCANGHICGKKCHHPLSCSCEVKMKKKIPRCGHNMLIECGQNAENFNNCDEKVDMMIELCGHVVQIECGRKFQIDDESPFVRKLMQKAVKCSELVEYVIPKCGHSTSIECCKRRQLQDAEESYRIYLGRPTITRRLAGYINCQTLVNVDLPCGHTKEVECNEKDSAKTLTTECEIEVEIVLTQCGHRIRAECSKRHSAALNTICKETISYTYPNCGHETQIQCYQNPQLKAVISKQLRVKGRPYKHPADDISPCSLLVEKTLDCGHQISIACHMKEPLCDKSCAESLVCEHSCLEACKICKSSILHKPCQMPCEKILVCGHPCAKTRCLRCKLCTKQCTFACGHSPCELKCTDICFPCEKPCIWECPHFKCTKLCSEPCDRPVCTENCGSILSCGHSCPGFCGEPCPSACVLCGVDQFKGVRVNKADTKIVTLIDCGHSFDCEYLDDYMSKHALKLISICPACHIVFHRHPRYDSILKKKKTYIEDVKRQLLQIAHPVRQFPFIDHRIIPKMEMYVGKYLTYLQIIGYIETDRSILNDIHLSKKKSENILHCIGQETNNFQNWMDISSQMFLIHVNWILHLCSEIQKLSTKRFNILEETKTVNDERDEEELSKSTYRKSRIHLEDVKSGKCDETSGIDEETSSKNSRTPTESTGNDDGNDDGNGSDDSGTKQVPLSSSIKAVESETYEDTGDQSDDSTDKNDKTAKYIRKMTVGEITLLIRENVRRGDHKSAKELLNLLVPYIEDEAHFSDAKDYPIITTAIGVHGTDWSICSKGHVTPSVIQDNCLTCSGQGEGVWVYTQQSRGRRKPVKHNKYGTNDPSLLTTNPEKVNHQGKMTAPYYEHKTTEQLSLLDDGPQRGRDRGRGRANYNIRRPYLRQGQGDDDVKWHRNTQPNRNAYSNNVEFRSQDTNWRRVSSPESSFEPQPDFGRGRGRRGNKRWQRQRGVAYERNQADQHLQPTVWMPRSDENTSAGNTPRGRGGPRGGRGGPRDGRGRRRSGRRW